MVDDARARQAVSEALEDGTLGVVELAELAEQQLAAALIQLGKTVLTENQQEPMAQVVETAETAEIQQLQVEPE